MTFENYDDFDACVRDHADKRDPEAYCAAIKRRAEGELSEEAVVTGLSDEPVAAHQLEQLTTEMDDWTHVKGVHGGSLWLSVEADAIVYDDRNPVGEAMGEDPDHAVGPAMETYRYRLEDGEVYCEDAGEVFEAAPGEECPHCGDTVPEAGTVIVEEMASGGLGGALSHEQTGEFAVDVFRIVQDEDDDMDLDGDLLGAGVDFPNAGVYVDWRIEAWPEDEQLEKPHVSDYGSIEDLEQATGGIVEPVETVDTAGSLVAQEATGGIAADDRDGEAVVISGLSQEARESVERTYNVSIDTVAQEGEYDGFTLGTDGDPGPEDAYHDFLDALVDAGADVWQVRNGDLHVWPRDDDFPLHDPTIKVVGIEESELQDIIDDHEVEFMRVGDGI